MSDVIKILPDHIANQIAAGEVIQRPASVVKELIENAMDAGATQIDLVVKDAGKTLIQVIDNGKGISENDLHLAFERHATSKIAEVEDIYKLNTKGFRGEALASIAAIAHVELKTKQADKELGHMMSIEGSTVKSVEPVVCANGSSFAVKNLFFNVPARRNFLKSDAVESKHILEEFIRIALTHEEVGFSYSHNGNEVYRLPISNNLRKRIVDVFGKSFNDKLVPIEEYTDIVGIKGFVLKPEFSKKTSGEQYFFVNNRFFKDRYFHHAVKTAFDNLIPKDHQVSYFIYFDVNPAMIDVNVHPTKTEIKFEEDRNIYSILRSTVRQTLGKFNITPTLDFDQEMGFPYSPPSKDEPIKIPTITVNPNFNPFDPSTFKPANGGSGGGNKSQSIKPNRDAWEQMYAVIEQPKSENSQLHELLDEEAEINPNTNGPILQIQQRYALCSSKTGVILIDLKRAQTRIAYDHLIQHFMMEPLGSQQLLFPVEREISVSEIQFLNEQEKNIERLGFQWRIENDLIYISGAPALLEAEQVLSYFDDILSTFLLRDIDVGEIVHTLVLSLAKASAGQTKRNMSQEELNHLVHELFTCAEHSFDPSGKKTLKIVDLKELTHDF
jgi:DNA mismatch repair protein MutL